MSNRRLAHWNPLLSWMNLIVSLALAGFSPHFIHCSSSIILVRVSNAFCKAFKWLKKNVQKSSKAEKVEKKRKTTFLRIYSPQNATKKFYLIVHKTHFYAVFCFRSLSVDWEISSEGKHILWSYFFLMRKSISFDVIWD